MTEVSAQERLAWLRLARTSRVGPVMFRDLVGRYGSAVRALEALPALVRRGGGPDLALPSIAEIEAEIATGEALGARLILSGEAAFPPLLAQVDPPPPAIWALGDPALLQRPILAIVGSRNASASGQRLARGLAGELGREGFVVASGMARGIDTSAHEGALATGTVAVLAGGVDDPFPPENLGLYRRIAEQGCIVSERPVGHRAKAKDFPRRNRIISGLARGVVVVEAELRSGSLITARLAAEQNREVFAVPGSPLEPRARGTNDLIRQGAVLCEGLDDILRALEQAPLRPRAPAAAARDPESEDHADELLGRLQALLSPTPAPRDELVRLTGAPAAQVYAALTELALAGRAELLPGGLAVSGTAR